MNCFVNAWSKPLRLEAGVPQLQDARNPSPHHLQKTTPWQRQPRGRYRPSPRPHRSPDEHETTSETTTTPLIASPDEHEAPSTKQQARPPRARNTNRNPIGEPYWLHGYLGHRIKLSSPSIGPRISIHVDVPVIGLVQKRILIIVLQLGTDTARGLVSQLVSRKFRFVERGH